MLKKGIEILALVLKLIILIIFAAVRIIAESAVGIILCFSWTDYSEQQKKK